jgi:rod shape-determining protein MreB
MSTSESTKAQSTALSQKKTESAAAAGKATPQSIVLGFDFGTNKSCMISGSADADDIQLGKIVPTVVGYVKEGIINGIR